MLNRNDIQRILDDLLRTGLSRRKTDAPAGGNENNTPDFTRLPKDVLQSFFIKAADMFGFDARPFSAAGLLTDYAFASYLKKRGVTFLTSSTTGTPKKCFHSNDMIRQEAGGVSFLFAGVKRIISLVPACHLYGFTFTVALPHALKVPVVSLGAVPAKPRQTFLQTGDLIVGFPLFWDYWLGNGLRFPPGVHVLSSTSPCKSETIRGLLNAGAKDFTEIYGASETGAIAHRHAPGTAFELFPFWEKAPYQPLQIRRLGADDWLRLPDRIQLQGERFLTLLKRKDGFAWVGGTRVNLQHIEDVLAAHPAVKACRVRLMRPEEGDRLKAFVVLNGGFSPQHMGLIHAYLANKLTEHELPRTFAFGPQLPVNALGKDADW